MGWTKGKPRSAETRRRISETKRNRETPVRPPVVLVPADRTSRLGPNAGKNILELMDNHRRSLC